MQLSFRKVGLLETMQKKPQLAKKKPNFLEADFVWKSWAFGNGAKKTSFAKKKPNFWEADFVQKSWAFGNGAKKAQLAKKKPNFLDADFVWKSWAFACFRICPFIIIISLKINRLPIIFANLPIFLFIIHNSVIYLHKNRGK